MTTLRLAKLADRTPVKLAIAFPPEVHERLIEYAAAYAEVYGQAEPIAELVPAIVTTFLDGDREFAKRRRGQPGS